MPKNKQLPEGLLSKLHGKGTMSEILDIERSRLLKQSEQDMKRQLGGAESANSTATQPGPAVNPVPALAQPRPESAVSQFPPHDAEAPPAQSGKDSAAVPSVHHTPAPGYPAELSPPAADNPRVYRGIPGIPQNIPEPVKGFTAVEGLSRFSRVVGDDLSDFGTIFRHSTATISQSPPHLLPKSCQDYYTQIVDSSLPFTAQRNLLSAIRGLTLGWGTMSCQITLELLSAASGIRNLKTVRKWLGDLHDKKHIRYTPVHGDLRGSIITLTPPQGLLPVIDQWRRERVAGGDSAAFPGMSPQGGDRHGL